MQFSIFQLFLFVLLVYAQHTPLSGNQNSPQVPYNWLTLAFVGSNDYLPRPHYHSSDRDHFKELCRRLDGLNPNQQAMCAENPFSIPFVARGVREAIRECENKFKFERWNCSSRDEVTETRHGKFQDILGKTLRSSNKEAAFLSVIMAASIVHSITKGCNTGNLTECGCDSKPGMQRYQADSDSAMSRDQFSWGGCSDNVPYGIRYARRFLDEWEVQQFEETKNVAHLVRRHNNFVGREAIAQNIRRQCRCHGVSGSCEFKTCWLQMQKFSQVSDLLKKRYDHFAVQVTRKATKRLRRKERTERKIPLRGNEMAYVHRSPSYCERNLTAGILGTSGRECIHNSYSSESCDLLCCGRGYNTRLEIRQTQCECKFVWCCEVKCKTCTEEVAVHTCK
ncbi:hypothetical protein B9Z55_014395 [Caenorhabditis nigoni]|uniref:Protein Wnt n=1 Tax=Caenorhabditis nigoni TaxID=1611254 RepID=A0A2G5U5T0_9PELO|nr:hypothetical protein B9Z55_014395 [Caenorhabditis nigoni]